MKKNIFLPSAKKTNIIIIINHLIKSTFNYKILTEQHQLLLI